MISTRNFFVGIVACIVLIVVGGVSSSSGKQEKTVTPQNTALLLAPHEAYDVAPYVEETGQSTRNAFIEKVRRTYIPAEKETVLTEDFVVHSVQNEVVSSSSVTYGNTGF